jgi:hypothetical protein
MEALADVVHADRPGVIIVSKPADPASAPWKPWSRSVVAIDSGIRIRLPFGSTFHPLTPGQHKLSFGYRTVLARSTRARVAIDVPANGQVTVHYRPALWPRGRAAVQVDLPNQSPENLRGAE